MKTVVRCIVLTVCAMLLAGCAKEQNPLPTEQQRAAEQTQGESTELDLLGDKIAERNCMVGVGFFGYIRTESDEKTVCEFAANSALAKAYPFLTECDPILYDGEELYAFVPANRDIAITVLRTETTEDGNGNECRDAPLYIGKPGEPVVLRCNLSEVCENVLIAVGDGTDTAAFHPSVSLKDGRVTAQAGCFDFSVYGEIEPPSAEIAQELLLGTGEVRDALERGMKLLNTEDVQTVEGRPCLLFALGTDHGDQFVRERLYAVSDTRIYEWDAEEDLWRRTDAR